MQAQKRARHRPDLRLAETYLPAAICLAKCVLLYCFVGPVLAGIAHAGTRLLVVTALLLCLYFDHLYPSAMGQQRFVDTNALCVDVVAGTLLSHMLGLDALGLHASIAAANALACGLWALGGAAHIYVGKDRALPNAIAHALTCAAVLAVTGTINACHWTGCIAAQHYTYPFGAHLRAVLYLGLVFVDAFALKPVWQRETDRLHLLRYGSVLLAHCSYGLPVCAVLLGAAQAARLFAPTVAAGCDMEQGSSSGLTSMTQADAEAFQLAREQYMQRNNSARNS